VILLNFYHCNLDYHWKLFLDISVPSPFLPHNTLSWFTFCLWFIFLPFFLASFLIVLSPFYFLIICFSPTLHPLFSISTHLQIFVLRELGFEDKFFFISLVVSHPSFSSNFNFYFQIRGTLWSIKYFVSGITGYMIEWDNWGHCALISYALGKIKSFLVEKK